MKIIKQSTGETFYIKWNHYFGRHTTSNKMIRIRRLLDLVPNFKGKPKNLAKILDTSTCTIYQKDVFNENFVNTPISQGKVSRYYKDPFIKEDALKYSLEKALKSCYSFTDLEKDTILNDFFVNRKLNVKNIFIL